MLTLYPPFEEEKILYLRNFALNIRNYNEKSLAAWRYRWLACFLSQVVRTSSPGSRPRQFCPSLPIPWPWTGLLVPLKKSSSASAEEFYCSFYCNEGLENKLTRASLLGLAKSIYYHYTHHHYYYCYHSQTAMRKPFLFNFFLPEEGCGKLFWLISI